MRAEYNEAPRGGGCGERKRLNTRLWNSRGGKKGREKMCRLRNQCVAPPATEYVSQRRARVREKRASRYARGHRECFIFSGLSNRRGRYMHALAAINDLISVSFHLPDYGQNSGVPVGRGATEIQSASGNGREGTERGGATK